MNIAIVIARGGSKRIRNKNRKLFFGKPVIAYSIIAALNSKIFNRVIVSTEDKIISNISRFYGAETPFKRPKVLADDRSSTISVVKHAIKKLSLNKKNINICCIYPVAPLLTSKLLIKGFKKFKNLNADFLFPVLKKKDSNKRFFIINQKGFLKETKIEKKKLYQDAGQFYWGKSKSFTKFNYLFSGKLIPLSISVSSGIDVNTKKDWKELYNLYKSKK